MKIQFFILCIFTFLNTAIVAQEHLIYLEIEGVTYGFLEDGYYGKPYNLYGFSLNYELRFTNTAIRVGVGRNIYENQSAQINPYFFAVPLEFLVISGGDHHFIEGGIFITSSFGDRFYNERIGTKYPANYIHFKYDYAPGLQIGYRFQPEIKHFIGRADLTMMHLSRFYNYNENFFEGYIHFTGGISLGYLF